MIRREAFFKLAFVFLLPVFATDATLQIDLCKTESPIENCAQTMPVDQVGNYPMTQQNEHLYFKITSVGNSLGVLWPVKCHLLNFDEQPDGSNMIINNGCPIRPRVGIVMNRNPVMVKFTLSEFTSQRPSQQSASIKCFVVSCKMNSNNISEACPMPHGCENRAESVAWANRRSGGQLMEANSAGYLLLNDAQTPPPPPNFGYNDYNQNHCASLLRQIQQSCPLQALELINIAN